MRLRFALALALMAACGEPPRATAPATAPRQAERAPAGTIETKVRPGERALAIAITATLPAVRLSFTASGPAEELTKWELGDEVPEKVTLGDGAGGALKGSIANHTLTIEGKPSKVVVSYELAPKQPDEDPRATIVEEARFRLAGEHTLALPAAFLQKPAAITIDVDAKAKAGQVAGSSIGFGREKKSKEVTLPAIALQGMTFLGGAGGHAMFDAPEGNDEAAWLGYTAFDPRSVSAEVAVFRGLLHDYFRGKGAEPSTLMLVVDARPKGRFRVTRRVGGVLVALSGKDAFDARLRLAVGHELVHAWIGDRLWLGDPTPGQEAKTYWFHEGVARWIAREQLYRAGLLSPDEYAAEMNWHVSILATSAHTQKTHDELAAKLEPGVVPLLVARGAIYATAIDARIREASAKQKSLDNVLKVLVEKAEKQRRLPEDAFHSAIAADVKADKAKETWDEIIVKGKRSAIDGNALGGCFEMREGNYDIYDPGIAVAPSREASAISGVRQGGPADKAGLKDGEKVLRIDEPSDAFPEMRVDVERNGAPTTITYRAASGTAKGPFFKRRAGLTDEACRKLALRQ